MECSDLTLGILAGGQSTRLGGRDKAWLPYQGVPQVLRWSRQLAGTVDTVLVSANRDLERYRRAGLAVVPDRRGPGLGPIAGLEVLAGACRTTWLLTLPVDLVRMDASVLPTLLAAATEGGTGPAGAFAVDEDGPQPLVAVWRVAVLRDAASAALDAGPLAARALARRARLRPVRLAPGIRLGNLNTPDDLAAAGIEAA